MPESDRPFASILLAVLLIAGGLVTLASGAGYMGDESVSEFVAALDVVAGLVLVVGGLCCFSGRPLMWKICLGAVIVEAIAGVGMMTVTVAGGIVLVALCALLVWWLHTRAIRGWFQV